MYRRILIAPDAFKDALSAPDVCRAIAAGICRALPDAEIATCPISDGGEGALEILAERLGMEIVEEIFCGPLGPLHAPRPARYGYAPDQKLAFVALTETAGLQLLPPEQRNPLRTTTYGVGMQIRHALARGAERVVVAIGGSATNDAGAGMAAALGWKFADKAGRKWIPTGGTLAQIAHVEAPSDLPKAQFTVLCDVQNPLYGPSGAAYTYARQKGASESEIPLLDEGLRHLARLLPDGDRVAQAPGAGAAGGMGFGCMFFLKAETRPGADAIMDLLTFEDKLMWADVVVTGEGSIDAQTLHGKLIRRLCERAARYGKTVVGLCGRLSATPDQIARIGLNKALCINPTMISDLPLMLSLTAQRLEETAAELAASWARHKP
ncbi:MAG: glycerate kinase [Saprospiraceae bacterium]